MVKLMNKTNYEELLKKREEERRARLTSATVLHEVVKHMDSESLVTALVASKTALSNSDFAEKLSEETGVSLEDLAKTYDKVVTCLRFVA